ncbi:MAG: hypothetical protein M3409_10415 [Gemmatimonadota bacterium]|nr:hypothetical protein [Gemmatimonadota bacterium]
MPIPIRRIHPLLFLPALLLLGSAVSAQEGAIPPGEERPGRFGVLVTQGVGGSPLGEIAERYETFAIPGTATDVRLLFRPRPTVEWQLGYTQDDFSLGDQIDPAGGRNVRYTSAGFVVGRSTATADLPLRLIQGFDAGVSRFRVAGAAISRFDGERYVSEANGWVFVLGISAGVELPLYRQITVTPGARWALNTPDFGGGDGYSALHRETDVGFKLFFTLGLRVLP